MGSKKVTMTEMYMKIGKHDPAPNKYKPLNNWKKSVEGRLKGALNLKSDRIDAIDDAKFASK